jgi:hypothetical protein
MAEGAEPPPLHKRLRRHKKLLRASKGAKSKRANRPRD